MDRRQQKRWKREQERRRGRLVEVDRIVRAKASGSMTAADSSRAFDEMLMRDTGVLAFYGDSTNMVAPWDSDMMLLPAEGSTAARPIPSNTGIVCRGEMRGYLVRKEGGGPEPMASTVEHFRPWILGELRIGEVESL
jgi:hypothetical protein